MVRAWTVFQSFDNAVYGGTIYASTFEDAEVMAARIDGWIDGEIIAQYCGNCGCELTNSSNEQNNGENQTAKGH